MFSSNVLECSVWVLREGAIPQWAAVCYLQNPAALCSVVFRL